MSDRRHFMSLMGGAVAGAVGPGSAFADPQEPDLIVHNARVHTVDNAMPKAQAFAVRAGPLCRHRQQRHQKPGRQKDRTFDAKGMMVVPGFIDTHNHAGAGGIGNGSAGGEGLLYNVHVGNPYDVEQVSIASIIAKLKAKAATLPPGTWVMGDFLDDTKLADKRPLNVHDLDKVSTDHPVLVVHRGGHTGFVNSKAFQMAGITKATPNPFGGTFDKDSDGELNGRVTDRAGMAFDKVGKWEQFTPAQRQKRIMDGVAFISAKFAQYGLTTVHHNEDGALEAIQEQRRNGKLKHRVSYEVDGDLLEAMIRNGIESGFGDEWVRLGATVGTYGGWLAIGTHHGDAPVLYRPARELSRQSHRDPGRSQRLVRAGASRPYPAQLPCQWRRRDRPHAHRL